MMRSSDKYAIAVRKPNEEISVKVANVKSLAQKIKFLKLPVFRGIINLIESLTLGFKALTYSAEQATGEEERPNHVAVCGECDATTTTDVERCRVGGAGIGCSFTECRQEQLANQLLGELSAASMGDRDPVEVPEW